MSPQNEKALSLYDKYPNLNNSVTAMCAIKAASNILNFDKGEEIIKKHNLYQSKCNKVKSTLISFYGKCGKLSTAKLVFRRLQNGNIDTMNAMMSAYIHNDKNNDAIKLYECNQRMKKDEISHILALKAYGIIGALEKGKEIHSKLGKMDGINIKNALISFYGHCKQINEAKNIFYSNSDCQQNAVSINSIMTALVNNECYFEALTVYKKAKNLTEDVSHLMAIKACIHCNDKAFGEEIVKKIKNINKKSQICSTLIDFYGHFGDMESAKNIFYEMDNNIKCSVNVAVLMNAYIENEKYQNALRLFEQMNEMKISKDANCFNMAIKACSHCGSYALARDIWSNRINDAKIKYDVYVMTAFIDCIARKGHLFEAYDLMMKYKKYTKDRQDDEVMHTALMAGCQKHKNVLIAQSVYDQIKKKFKHKKDLLTSSSVLMRNLYNHDSNK